MRLMHWSWREYCELPSFHLRVLRAMLEDEQRAASHRRALDEARRMR